MAGTINISLTQQFDAFGKPLAGGLLYLFQAATTTPQNGYFDTDLSLPYPNPLVLDSSGRIPPFYLADGSIRARLTDANGVVQFDYQSLLVTGASSGSGGSSSVDPNAIFQTGFPLFLEKTGTLAGFVRDNARTIGSASSGASERANADCEALFAFYWNGFSNTLCPVPGGRGANAAADWAADKQITTLNKRGVVQIGLDDMGNSAAGLFAGAPTFVNGSAIIAGSIGGENTHTLTTAELAAHLHLQTAQKPFFKYATADANTSGSPHATFTVDLGAGGVNTEITSGDGTPGSTANAGGGGAHNIMQRFITGSWYRKL